MAAPQVLHYRDEAGKVYEVPKDQVATADRAGLVPATEADVAAALKRAEAGSTSGQVKAGLEGLAAGTFDAATAIPRVATAVGAGIAGAEDPLARVSGRQFIEDVRGVSQELLSGGRQTAESAAREYAEGARLRAEENPLTATGSYIGGQIVGAGGIAGIARGAGGLATKALGAGRAARIAGAGVAGALEGAPLSLVAAQDQAYIENRKLTGEQALAATGMGALIGFGVGGTVKSLGEALGAGRQALANRAARPTTEAATEAGEKSVLQKVLRTSDDDINRLATDVLGEAPNPKMAQAFREAVGGKSPSHVRAARYARATEDLTGNLSQVVKASNEIGDEVFTTAAKRAHVEANLAKSGINASEAIGKARAAADAIFGDLSEAVASYEGQAPKVLQGLHKQVAKQASLIAKAERAEDAYMAFDQIRRNLLDTSKAFDSSAARVADVDAQASMRALAERVGKQYDGAWSFLMDEGTWGLQGKAQAEINQAAVDFIEAKKFAFGNFADKVGESYVGPGRFRPVHEVNDGKVAGLVRRFGTPDGAFAARRFNQYIDAAERFSEAVGRGVELPPAQQAALDALRGSTGAARKTFGEVAETAGAMNQAEALLSHMREGSGALGGGLAGSMVGGPVGTAIGMAVGAAANPVKFMGQRLAVEQLANRSTANISKTLDRFFQTIERQAGKLQTERIPTTGAKTATALELFQGKHATPELAYRERAKEILAADENYGQRIRDNAGRVYGGTADVDPHSVGAAVIAATKGIQLLKAKMPSGLNDPKSLTPMTTKQQPSRAEIMEFAQLHTAVTKPMAVIEDIPKGTVTRDQIDAIAQVYPALYNHIRTETFNRLMALDQKGIEVPIRQRLILDSLLDLDGAGEPTFSTEFAVKYQQGMSDQTAMANEAQRPRPSPSKSNAGERLQTQTATMLGGK